MSHKNTPYSLLACAVLLTTGLNAHASGLKVNIVSASALGNANAGRGAVIEDASTVYYNPAAMTEFDKKTVSGGLFFASVKGQLSNINVTDKDNNALVVGQGYDDGGDFVPDPIAPFAYYIHPINETIAAGVGLFPAFGTETRYSRNAVVGEFATATKLQAVDIQPAIAYKINDQLSVGLGVDLLLVSGELSKQSEPTTNGQGFQARVVVKGDDTAVGFNLSTLWQPLETTRVGVSYHSAIDVELDGKGEFIQNQNGVWKLANKNDLEKGKVPLNLPQSLDISVDHAVSDKLSLQASALWMEWSVFEKFDVVGSPGGYVSEKAAASNASLKKENLIARVYTNWVDTLTASVGATYQMNDQLKVRTGFMFDQDTAKSGDPALTRVPGADQYWLTAGANYAPSEKLSIDVGGAYVLPVKATIKDYETDANGNLYGNNAKVIADSEVNAIAVSAQINYKF